MRGTQLEMSHNHRPASPRGGSFNFLESNGGNAVRRLTALLLTIFALMLAGCDRGGGPTSANTPQEMFRYTIEDPIPPGITNLQGVGDTWQGYNLFLRFGASDADIDAIIAKGYEPTTWAEVSEHFEMPESYNLFTPRWAPDSIVSKECHELVGVSNSWTGHGWHYLVIDRDSGTVYFHGGGI